MRKLFLLFILAVFVLTACGGKPTQPAVAVATLPSRPTPAASELQLTNPKDTIEVAVGDEFTITVKTFIDQNYHWEVAEELDTAIVEYVWKDYVPDKPNELNSAGKDVWRFKAVGPGTTTITLGYYQGMSDVATPKTVFTIVVK